MTDFLNHIPLAGNRLILGPLLAEDVRAVAAFIDAVAKPVCVMIETPAAVLGCPALAAVPGVVGLIAGTNDLCAATGIRGDAGRAGLVTALQTMLLVAPVELP